MLFGEWLPVSMHVPF